MTCRSPFIRNFFFLTLFAHAFACSDSPSTSTSDGGDSGATTDTIPTDTGSKDVPESDTPSVSGIPIQTWQAALARVFCTTSCAPLSGLFGSDDACVTGILKSPIGNLLPTDDEEKVIAGVNAGRITYDPIAAKECLEAQAALPCTDQIEKPGTILFQPLEIIPRCREVFVGSKAVGESCHSDFDCVGGQLSSLCEIDASTCEGTCIALGNEGSACGSESGAVCGDDFYCDNSDKKCHARLADGAACSPPPADNFNSSYSSCVIGHWCLDGKCGAPAASVAANEPCWIATQCPAGHTCTQETAESGRACLPALSLDAPCNPAVGVGADCGQGLECITNAEVATCVTSTPPPAVGEACTGAFTCALEAFGLTYCDVVPSNPTCRKAGAAGEPCSPTFFGENCESGFFCDAGTCAAQRAADAACETAAQCASGSCIDKKCTTVCVAPAI